MGKRRQGCGQTRQRQCKPKDLMGNRTAFKRHFSLQGGNGIGRHWAHRTYPGCLVTGCRDRQSTYLVWRLAVRFSRKALRASRLHSRAARNANGLSSRRNRRRPASLRRNSASISNSSASSSSAATRAASDGSRGITLSSTAGPFAGRVGALHSPGLSFSLAMRAGEPDAASPVPRSLPISRPLLAALFSLRLFAVALLAFHGIVGCGPE
jgi:hypothetical protein